MTTTTEQIVTELEKIANGNIRIMRKLAAVFIGEDMELFRALDSRVDKMEIELHKKAAELDMTVASVQLFSHIVKNTSFDFCEDNTDEYICGFMSERDLRIDKATRGNLSDLKKKGLLTMDYSPDFDPRHAGYWVHLTEKGQAAAEALGISCCA